MIYSFREFIVCSLSKKYCIWIQTPKETNHEIKPKRYVFSAASDNDVEKSCSLI